MRRFLIYLAVFALVVSCTNKHVLKRNGEVIYELETTQDEIEVKYASPDGETVEFNSKGEPGLLKTLADFTAVGVAREIVEGDD